MEPLHYDAIVIGSGQGGTPLARALADAGWSAALVEREHVGGTCINEGCTPTKTVIASARVAYLARRGSDYGVNTSGLSIDLARVRQRKREIVDSFRNGSQKRLESTKNLTLIFGAACFAGPKTIEIELKSGERKSFSADYIFINTGTSSASPKLEGLDSVPALDNASIMELERVPEHLLVLGGGYIALEFGQAFRRFGSGVTIVQSAKQLLVREDADVAAEVLNIMKQDGIRVLLEASAIRVSKSGEKLTLTVRQGNKEQVISGSHLLVATGRKPKTAGLNLAAAGIETDARGFIKVNERLETKVAGVYALGDVKGGPAFTHISYDDFRIIRANLLEKKSVTTSGRLVPYTLFTDPQLGRVGLTETEARAQGISFRVAKMPMSYVARALEMDESRGFIKAIVDANSGQILGAAVLGIEGGEIMAELQIAMLGKLPFAMLRDAVFAHPTLAESLNNLFTNFV